LVHPGEELALFNKRRTGGISIAESDSVIRGIWSVCRNATAKLQIARWPVELAIREDPKDEEDQINGPGHGKHYLLRDLKTGAETEFGSLPGFDGVFGLLHDSPAQDQHFLFDGPLRLAFFDLHLNNTDGDTVFALDLTGSRVVSLSPKWATPIPLPGA